MSTEGFKPLDEPGAPETMRDFRAEQKVFHRYTLKRMLGRGGMGVVWLAHDEKLDQEVALKFLPETVRQDPNAVDELKRETRRSLKLTHPNIVRIYDFVDDETTAGISMEFIEGATFAALRSAQPQKIFSPEELMPLIKQLCAALDYAHNDAKVVHRDLKPSNLMVTKRGQVKVADFGIARSVSDSMSRITMSQGTSGTLVYMSPQQLSGLPSVPTDDVYALGATIYELVAGRPPFFSGDITYQIREVKPPSVADRWEELEINAKPIPTHWEKTIASCLSKDPAQRPQSAGAVAERLASPPAAVDPVATPPSTMVPPTMATMGWPNASAPPAAPKPVVPLATPAVKPVAALAPRPAAATPAVTPSPKPLIVVPPLPQSIVEPSQPQKPQLTPPRPTPPPVVEPVKKKSYAGLIAVVALVVVGLCAFLGWYFNAKVIHPKPGGEQSQPEPQPQPQPEPQPQPQPPPHVDEPIGPRTLAVPEKYPSIQNALNAARPGDTVHVHAGVYDEMIKFKEGVKLEGDNPETVVVRCSATGGNALWAQNCESGLISDITFEHTGENTGENRFAVIALLGSNLELVRCYVQNSGGYGVVIKGGKNTLRGCKLRANAWGGVYVGDKAAPLLKDNLAAGNKANGITFEAGSSGTAEENNCQNNSFNGIYVAGAGTSLTLHGNHCTSNAKHGIIIENGATATADNNTCEKNQECGIIVSGGEAALTHNQCVRNIKHGIAYAAAGDGTAERNVCSENGWSGILADGHGTSVHLSANRAENNTQWGIISQNGANAQIDKDNIVSGNVSGQIQH